MISTRDFRDALCFELTSANSAAEALPLRGNVVASPSDGNSRGFHTGEPVAAKNREKHSGVIQMLNDSLYILENMGDYQTLLCCGENMCLCSKVWKCWHIT